METKKITEQEYLNAIKMIDEYSKIINQYYEQLKNHSRDVVIINRNLKKCHELTESDRLIIPCRLDNILKFNFRDVRLCDITKDEFFKARNAGKGSWNDLCELTNKIHLKIK
jgi:hypothetical protein